MDNILFRYHPSCSIVFWKLRFTRGFVFLFALPHDRFEQRKMNYKWSTRQMSCVKNHAKYNIYVALVLLLRRARQQTSDRNCCILKNKKSDGSEWWIIIILQMMRNQNKNSIGLIDCSQGFARCAQMWLATKIVGATSIQNIWVKWTVGSWYPVGTSIVLVRSDQLLNFVRIFIEERQRRFRLGG